MARNQGFLHITLIRKISSKVFLLVALSGYDLFSAVTLFSVRANLGRDTCFLYVFHPSSLACCSLHSKGLKGRGSLQNDQDRVIVIGQCNHSPLWKFYLFRHMI